MFFHYKAQLSDGTTVEGDGEASDQFELARKIKTEGKILLVAKEVRKKESELWEYVSSLGGRVSLKEKVFFARNLGVMIGAGLSLTRALSILKKETKSNVFKKTLASLEETVTRGKAFNESLGEFPNVFSPLVVAMVKSGEASGTLAESLKTVAHHLEQSYILQRRISGALVYPAVIITAMIIIGIGMIVFVVPTLTSTFADLGVPLPRTTRAIIFLSDFFRHNGLIAMSIVVLTGIATLFFLRSKIGTEALGIFFLKVPPFSQFTKEINSARTARTLASLLSSGVNILEAISITKEVIQNSSYKRVLDEAATRVQKGDPLSLIFSNRENLYPILVSEMIAVGEETGKLSYMLGELAQFYEDEIEQKTKNLSTIIEPVLMILIGAAVGVFAYSMITPLYSVLGGI